MALSGAVGGVVAALSGAVDLRYVLLALDYAVLGPALFAAMLLSLLGRADGCSRRSARAVVALAAFELHAATQAATDTEALIWFGIVGAVRWSCTSCWSGAVSRSRCTTGEPAGRPRLLPPGTGRRDLGAASPGGHRPSASSWSTRARASATAPTPPTPRCAPDPGGGRSPATSTRRTRRRPLAEVVAEAAAYRRRYGVGAVFADQVTSDAADLGYYRELAGRLRPGPARRAQPGHGPARGLPRARRRRRHVRGHRRRPRPPATGAARPDRRLSCHLVHDAPPAPIAPCSPAPPAAAPRTPSSPTARLPNPWDGLPTGWAGTPPVDHRRASPRR